CFYLCFVSCNVTPTIVFYALSLHDALPISIDAVEGVERICSGTIQNALERVVIVRAEEGIYTGGQGKRVTWDTARTDHVGNCRVDRKSTRLNSSHVKISYAVFCLKKKKNQI